ncbi:MAG: transposase [Deferrisomatales bacterium]|nr:transposase [Deferrisomatales bacterium]
MARPLRIEYPGAFYHVTSRGNERKDIFRSKRDREKFLDYLGSATVRYGARIHVYCLMSNHYHLLVETPEGNLSRIMRHINGAYTTYFNVKRQRSGHLLQGRYKAILVEREEHLVELSRYVHLNPVAARMVGKPGEHVWSSYNAYVGAAASPDWLERRDVLARFGEGEAAAGGSYRAFVEGDLDREVVVPSPWEKVVGSTVLGSRGFVEWVQETFIAAGSGDREVPAARALAVWPSLDAIEAAVARGFPEDSRLARKLALYLSHRHSGRPLKDIGNRFGLGPSGVSEASRSGAQAVAKWPEVRRRVAEIAREVGITGF